MDFVGKHSSVYPAAAGGYVIEDYATIEAKKRGVVDIQKVPRDLGGSRPDFMIPLGGNYYGLLDATAQKSAGHILSKSGQVNNGFRKSS